MRLEREAETRDEMIRKQMGGYNPNYQYQGGADYDNMMGGGPGGAGPMASGGFTGGPMGGGPGMMDDMQRKPVKTAAGKKQDDDDDNWGNVD